MNEVSDGVDALGQVLRKSGHRVATAESCTGGLIAAACTSVAGSSDWFECGFVTYSNAAKTDMLGVDATVIAEHGAVSEAVVRAMAEGARTRAQVRWAVAVSGIAGPAGGSRDKPVGTVWLALAGPGPTTAWRVLLDGDRTAVRTQTVEAAVAALLKAASPSSD